MTEACTRLPGTVWPACRCTDCRKVAAKLAKRFRNNALGNDQRAAAWAQVAAWEADGVSPGLIAHMTGLTTRGADALLSSVRAGTPHRIYHRTVQAILDAGKQEIEGRGLLNAISSQRRLQALAVMGWPLDVIAERTGLDGTALAKVRRGTVRRTHPHVAKAIKVAYDELWSECGPSKLAAARARTSGWVPPMAWDDIDDPKEIPAMGELTCSQPDCDKPVKARGLCNPHYIRSRRHGSPTSGGKARILDDETRLWSQIDKGEHCWVWTASGTQGYGTTLWRGEQWRVHRLVYTLLVGPIPEGLQLDHLCRNRACCRPDHLEPVTQQENIARGERATRQTCPEGHPYDTVIERRGGKERRCSVCANARRRTTVNAGKAFSEVIENVEFILEHEPYTTATELAHRLGYRDSSGIQIALRRGDRTDLLAQLARNAEIAA